MKIYFNRILRNQFDETCIGENSNSYARNAKKFLKMLRECLLLFQHNNRHFALFLAFKMIFCKNLMRNITHCIIETSWWLKWMKLICIPNFIWMLIACCRMCSINNMYLVNLLEGNSMWAFLILWRYDINMYQCKLYVQPTQEIFFWLRSQFICNHMKVIEQAYHRVASLECFFLVPLSR